MGDIECDPPFPFCRVSGKPAQLFCACSPALAVEPAAPPPKFGAVDHPQSECIERARNDAGDAHNRDQQELLPGYGDGAVTLIVVDAVTAE